MRERQASLAAAREAGKGAAGSPVADDLLGSLLRRVRMSPLPSPAFIYTPHPVAHTLKARNLNPTFNRRKHANAACAANAASTHTPRALKQDSGGRRQLDDARVLSAVKTFLFAGHDTSSSALAWALYQLAANPAVQVRHASPNAASPAGSAVFGAFSTHQAHLPRDHDPFTLADIAGLG